MITTGGGQLMFPSSTRGALMARNRSVADQLVGQLVAAGVRHIYGIVGDSLNPVVDAVRRTEGIEWVQVRHEEAGAFAAAAEAELTGTLAVCAGSCGPGNLHLINGLYDANRSRVPVLAIASHIPSEQIGTQYFQETHPDRLFTECSVYSEMISNAAQAPRVIRSAIHHAYGAPGVAVLTLPGDVAGQGQDRDAGGAICVVNRAADDARRLGCVRDHLGVHRALGEEPIGVGLLEVLRADLLARDVRGNRENGDP